MKIFIIIRKQKKFQNGFRKFIKLSKSKKKKSKLLCLTSPIFFGFVVGSLAVLAQPVFKIQPPQAYGICIVCHARDLLNWLSILLFKFRLDSAEATAALPLLTTVGIFLGSVLSSRLNNEYKFIKTENLIKMFFWGLIVSNFGLVIMSCPTRLVLRFAFGDPFALLSIIGLLAGISIGVIFLKKGV
ncbi:MAG: cytochrome C [Candidatus Humimicrobiaceae bacterium]